ncbi:MAG: ferrous iron transport protein B [Verrucomicrobia bacterium]|nr:ferrous iron transport protein B [Verrucomicrobiota bacterium]
MSGDPTSKQRSPSAAAETGAAPRSSHDPSPATRHPYVVITGNPNCGKTTLFNALTGLRAKVGNYAGVTVERKEGKLLGADGRARHSVRAEAGSKENGARGATRPAGDTPGDIRVLDLPGTYSLSPNSLDEQISRDVLMNRLPELPPPDLIVVVVDGSNLQRNLYYATQVVELGHPTIIALNMVDVAEANGHKIDETRLTGALGVPVMPVVASTGKGIPQLRQKIIAMLGDRARHSARAGAEAHEDGAHLPRRCASTAGGVTRPTDPSYRPRLFCQLPGRFRIEAMNLAELLAATFSERKLQATAEALLILTNERALASSRSHYPQQIQDVVAAARKRLDAANVDWRGAPIEWRYARVAEIQRAVTTELSPPGETFSDKLDRVLTDKIWGTLIFVAVMALMFQSIFTFAKWPMDGLQFCLDWFGGQVGQLIPRGDLNDLLVNGVIAGVGAVVVFLPQILLLFLFIGFLEDTGYMSRAAFLMDRLMSQVGLHGKSFIPMLSSYACAIPGIMATRTIETPKDRLVTILVAPLMSCSARLPVYTLLIAACIPHTKLLGFFGLQGLTMLSMYLLGTVVALLMAWVFKKTLLKGETPMLIMELPPYKLPLLRVVVRHMWDRAKLFIRRAGTVILGINILLWFLATYPKNSALEKDFETKRAALKAATVGTRSTASQIQTEIMGTRWNASLPEQQLTALATAEAGEKLRHSFAGMMGQAIEPAIAPLGFDWKIGIGIVASFAAREVFVSTMSTVYNVGNADANSPTSSLAQTLREQKRPDGTPVYTTLVAVTLMVFYVFALQCVSTVAVVRRETNSWKWPFFQWLYMGILAWVLAFVTYQGGRLLGWG